MCIYMYMCQDYQCVHIYMYMHIHTCVHINVHVHVYIHVHIHVHVIRATLTSTCVYIYTLKHWISALFGCLLVILVFECIFCIQIFVYCLCVHVQKLNTWNYNRDKNGCKEALCSVLPAFNTCRVLNGCFKNLTVVINMYSNWLQQDGELIFDISLKTSYDNISSKASKYHDILSLN